MPFSVKKETSISLSHKGGNTQKSDDVLTTRQAISGDKLKSTLVYVIVVLLLKINSVVAYETYCADWVMMGPQLTFL